MKKVFLLFASALMGVASIAGNEWSYEDGMISIPYNSYGTDSDGDGTADQFQAGNANILGEAVFNNNGNSAWVPAIGETFMISMKGTANFNGKVQVFIVDERPEVSYWADLTGTCGEFDVVKGETFQQDIVLAITTIAKDEVALTTPDLVFGIVQSDNTSSMETWNSDACEFTMESFEVLYEEAQNLEDPLALTFKGVADNEADGYKYQGQKASIATSAKAGQYVNVEFEGTAVQDIAELLYGLVDCAADASYWTMMADDMFSFASEIHAGDKVSKKFSVLLTVDSPAATQELNDVFLAQDLAKGMNLYFSNFSLKSSVSDSPLYEVGTAVEEVANVAFENGVIYSSSIVVYNVAGQVVATASQEFNINSLNAGIYFAQTAEGSISFQVK